MFEPLTSAWQNFHFLRPDYLWLLLLPILIYGGLWRFNTSRVKGWSIEKHLLDVLLVDQKKLQRFNPITVSLLLSLLVILVLAGPSWQKQKTPFMQESSDLVFVLEVSESMLQDDIQPSRLARAKQKIYDLLSLRQGGRAALIVYAGTAHQVVPLTADKEIIWNFLLAIDETVMPVAGDNILAVLPLLDALTKVNSLQKNEGLEGAAKLSVLLLSDNIASEQAETFAQSLADNKALDIHLLGIGKQQVGQGLQPLNEAVLKSVARKAGGSYQRVSNNNQDITAIQRSIKQQVAAANNNDKRPFEDGGYYLLLPIALLFLLWFRKGWTLQWSLIFILALSFSITDKALASAKKQEQKQEQSQSWFLDLWLTADQKGQYYFNQQQYEKAALAYQDSFKKGVAFYYAGKFSEAYQQFKTIDSEQALFYQANSLAQQRNYVPARDLYQVLIEQNPEFTAAKTNLAIVDNIIKETDAFTDKQQEEQSEGGQELGDNPQSSEGAQRKMGSAESQLGKKPEQETADDLAKERGAVTGLTAEQILQDEALQESWLKEVTQDPAAFLGAKFQIQASKKAEDLEVLQ